MNQPIRYQFALLTACAVLPVTGLFAQAPATEATPSVSVPATTTTTTAPATTAEAGKHRGERRAMLASLTPEERQKLKAAHEKAKQDPAVKSAEATRETDRRGYHQAMRAAMLRADPSIQPILEKLREEGHHGKKNA